MRPSRTQTLSLLLVIVLAGPAAADVDGIRNGGFELGMQDWAASGAVGASGSEGTSHGTLAALFNSGDSAPSGIVSQLVPTVPGETYTVSFDWGAFSEVFVQPQTLRAEAVGQALLGSLVAEDTGSSPTTFDAYSFDFVADSAFTLVSFTDISAFTASIDGILDHVSVVGPEAPRFPVLLVRVVYSEEAVVTGPVSFGLSSLPATFTATFAIPGEREVENVTAGLGQVSTAMLRFGDGLWATDLTSFSLATDANGEVTTLSYATGPLTTPTAVAGKLLNSSFSATIQGTDIASGDAFEYTYSASAQTLVLQQPETLPGLGAWGMGALACALAVAAWLAPPRRRRDD